jgi:DNA-binding transcriptional LysR family regulator
MRIDPTTLRLFLRVAETGTLARAAETENLVPAAVSKRISELEALLDTPLLCRTNKGVTPTPAGNALLGLARRVLSELDQIPVHMRDFSSGVRGLVRISASMSAICQFIPFDLQRFSLEYPDIRIQLTERPSSEVAGDIEKNAADLGVFTSYPVIESLSNSQYHTDKLVLCVPQTHHLCSRTDSVSFSEIADNYFIGLPVGSSTDALLNRAASSISATPNIRIRATSFDAMCVMIDCGLGVGLLPESVALRHALTLNLHVLEVNEPWTVRHFNVCCRANTSELRAVRLLVEHLNESARKRAMPAAD